MKLSFVYQLFRMNVLVAIIAFATSIILARTLEPEGRGQLASILLWPVLISHLALCGVHMSMARSTAHNLLNALANYRSGFRTLAVTSSIAVIIYCGINFWLQYVNLNLNDHIIGWVFVAALIIPFSMWNTFQIQMELGRLNLFYYNFGRFSFAISYFLLILLLWLAGFSSPIEFILAFLASSVVACIMTHFAIQKTFTREARTHAGQLSPILKVLRDSAPFALSVGLISLAASADKMLVSVFFDSQAMGLYVVGLAFAQIQSVVNEAIAPLFFTRVAQLKKIGKADMVWMQNRLRQTVLINGVIAIIMLLAAPLLLTFIYGDIYVDSLAIVLLIIPALSVRSMMRSFEEVLKGANRPMNQSIAIVAMTGVFLAGGVIATTIQSISGIALSQLIASIVGLSIVANEVAKYAGLKISDLLIPHKRDVQILISEIRSVMVV